MPRPSQVLVHRQHGLRLTLWQLPGSRHGRLGVFLRSRALSSSVNCSSRCAGELSCCSAVLLPPSLVALMVELTGLACWTDVAVCGHKSCPKHSSSCSLVLSPPGTLSLAMQYPDKLIVLMCKSHACRPCKMFTRKYLSVVSTSHNTFQIHKHTCVHAVFWEVRCTVCLQQSGHLSSCVPASHQGLHSPGYTLLLRGCMV